MTDLDYSRYIICLANGENDLYRGLNELREKIKPKFRFRLEITGLHCGDIMLGIHDSEYENEYVLSNFMQNPINQLRPLLLIERKTIQDFCRSFRSNHYKNQKSRMMSFRSHTNTRCVLVVEGYYEEKIDNISPKYEGIMFNTLEQCFTSIRIRDNFFVKHVENTYFHAEFLIKCLSTIERYQVYKGNYQKNVNANGNSMENNNIESIQDILKKDYADSVKVQKKNNMTPELCYSVQLSSIPGISLNYANIIATHYPNTPLLIKHLEKNGKHGLSEIKVGKNRLGKIKSERIYNYYFFE